VRHRFSVVFAAALLALASLVSMAAAADATAPPLLTKSPEDGKPGVSAGRIGIPSGIAVDPHLPGDVYIVDSNNQRIDVFTPWGSFVRAWGWGVKDGKAELETCTTQTECQKGQVGSGAGQFDDPEAVTVDGSGDVYVMEAENHRVQKFDPEGNLLLAFGSAGAGPGQFGGSEFAYTSRLAVNPVTGAVFVGEGERVQVFEATGSFKEEIKMPSGKVRAVAVDGAGKLYVAFANDPRVRKLEPHGPAAVFLEPSFEEEPEPAYEAALPSALAFDGSGDLYTIVGISRNDNTGEIEPSKVLEFDTAGKCLDCRSGGEDGEPGFDRSIGAQLEGVTVSGACGPADIYVASFNPRGGSELEASFFSVFGASPEPGVCPPPVHAPEVREQYALSVDTGGAEVAADINPRFWRDTSFRVEYGIAPCSLGGCHSTGARVLTSQVTSAVLPTTGVFLESLKPGTTYYYRFVAQSSGGGPVYGVDPDGPGEASFADGVEGSFTTFRSSGSLVCPENEVFRVGPSALLPDCRAYEMVSPLDKEGGDISVLVTTKTKLPAVLDQSAVDGGRFAYGSYRAFGGAESAPASSQYVADRHEGEGWISHPISPPRTKALSSATQQLQAEFKAFSPDLCDAWVQSFADPPLAAGASEGFTDLYRRTDEECGGKSYTALNTMEPPSAGMEVELQGLSADGSVAVFRANQPLASGGSAGNVQLYGVKGSEERFLCVLPGGNAFEGSCAAGWSTGSYGGQEDEVSNAVSADGQRVFWTASGNGSGSVYVRENPFVEGSECIEEGSPCTIAVSQGAEEAAGTKGSQFWAAAQDGSRAIFTTAISAGNSRLYEFRLGDQSTHLIAGEVLGLLGASSDASRVYVASKEALAGTNVEGRTPVAGQPNLYFWEAGQFRFIGMLSSKDLDGGGYQPIEAQPQYHASRVSPDGLAVAFVSYAHLTGYDNTDANSGRADSEVFVYDAGGNGGGGKLVCASCNPSGVRPTGREYLRILIGDTSGPWTAARIPVPEDILYASRVLSDNGKRLFFDSYDALSPRDTNGRQDVYEWEAPGEGRCEESSSSFSPRDGGCVDLISSGKSTVDSEFLDASPSGSDVFFTTLSSLLPQDPGLVDVYDARVDGGLPAPAGRPGVCEGEACQPAAVGPVDVTPGSLTFSGHGDLLSEQRVLVKPKAKVLTSAQRLAAALRACRSKPKRKRASCKALAHKKYAIDKKARKANSDRGSKR
jgi:hypothetical protein